MKSSYIHVHTVTLLRRTYLPICKALHMHMYMYYVSLLTETRATAELWCVVCNRD